MKHITVRDIERATEGTMICMGREEDESEAAEREVTDLCIDSREVKEGSLFVPLSGENTDGHRFLPGAMKQATAALTAMDPEEVYTTPEAMEEARERGDILIRVRDTEKALQDVGAYIRMQYEPPVIGVTGSVGKTTTRRMIATALSGNREVYETPGNLNSRYGVPIATSRMLDRPSEVAVLEMGIDRIGEMDILQYVARPEIAVCTMIGVCHMEYFGTQEVIRREKLKVASEDAILFLNADDALLREMKGHTTAKETYYYGLAPDAEYRAEDVTQTASEMRFVYCHEDVRVPVKLPVLGEHNVRNAVVAMAICDYLGMDLDKAADALAGFEPMRQLIRRMPTGTILIDDVYNASPDSMKAALKVLSDHSAEGRHMAVLGDMFELGSNEAELHGEVGDFFRDLKVDDLVVVGDLARELAAHAGKALPSLKVHVFETLEEASSWLREELKPEDVVLLKASHGMHFDEIVTALMGE